jgi:hypothetical protein
VPLDNHRTVHDRAETRKHLFVLAALRSESAVAPVRVRNVSNSGMLIEGTVLPPVGSRVEIERGSATAGGFIVWSENGRAGIKLCSSIDIEGWLPRISREQACVDALVQSIRSEDHVPRGTARLVPTPATRSFDLSQLANELDAVSGALVADTRILIDHSEDLQRLDIIAQCLRLLAKPDPKRI